MPDGSVGFARPATQRSPRRAQINPVVGLVHAARTDALHFFTSMGAQHDIVEFPNPFGKFFLVNEPEFIQRILESNYRNYPKSDFYQRVKPIFGEGLFELEGEH